MPGEAAASSLRSAMSDLIGLKLTAASGSGS
jgi:hypothetical protein